MPRRIIIVAVLATFAASALADYVAERKAAVALVRAGKHAEALAKFTQMVEMATSDVQKSDALQQAALCAQGLQQYDRAMEFARKIPLLPLSKTCQMQVLEGQRRWKDIVDRFKDEDIESWPESVRGDAFFGRGHASFVTKNGEAAAQDLEKAVEYLTDGNSMALCLLCLGDTYATLLRDDAKAINTYRRTYGSGNVYKHCQAAMSVAGILERQRNYPTAIDELSRIKLDEVTAPLWRGRLLCALGRALAGVGRKADAIARYKEALSTEGLPGELRMECDLALKKLGM